MSVKKDLSNILGNTYNYLTVIADRGSSKRDRTVLAKCVCGIEKEYVLRNIIKGYSKSCGCVKPVINRVKKPKVKAHWLQGVYYSMKARCYNKNSQFYEYYGGRGVRMCDEWKRSYKKFFDWAINNGWQKGLEIDKDLKGGGLLYSPETCVFVTRKINCNNRISSLFIEYNEERKTAAEWCDILGISQTTFYQRRKAGWSIEKCMTTPLMNNQFTFKKVIP